MNRNRIVVLVLVLFLLLLGISTYMSYNRMVDLQEKVERDWSQVQNVYQRRADLIVNLAKVVKSYATHEQETLRQVTEARASATAMTVDASNLTPEALMQFQAAQDGLSQALGRLMVIRENYPTLKADAQYNTLMIQLEGTENRITVERKRFNETAQTYNTAIRRFPTTIIASMFGFEKRPYFEAKTGTDVAPDLDL
ncbi:LemA family protein [Porphyromonas crevioricanis]|uniref:LemA family n=2 Tax=Porphyromonas crevioricanis TaxID=393921 RepID=A0A0A2FR99_9PORP|nr:LemA family protein [Porphyromonas crevioricanis]KGN89347.1 LemA family protein [Porphyromonas crevioricanis]KGN93528.1 LemA family protein [Porphyromonas crevioricanis]SJZ87977.1 LemA protein [Porphyromonas crevioricanis]SQH73134.1 LemA family [Porphyromonas crevioricanis]GAD05997.1 LemA family protein [Porphyromonas crevioricanis JCM 15906]